MPPRGRGGCSRVSRKYLKLNEYGEMTRDKNHLLGSGAFGDVYRVTRNARGEVSEVAMKFIKKQLVSVQEQKDYMREVEVLSRLEHCTLLPLIGFTIPMGSNTEIMLATPYMNNGSLHDVCKKAYGGQAPDGWDETKKSCCALGIAVGMYKIHKENIIHRDLKSDNVLLDDEFNPVIADFGLSKILSTSDADNLEMTQNKGTPLYMAPELFMGDPHYTQKVDVYAYAMILYELCTGMHPFQDKGDIKAYTLYNYITNNIRPTINDECPPNIRSLMEACWDQNPENRPSFEEIVKKVNGTDTLLFDGADLDDYQDYESRILEGIDLS